MNSQELKQCRKEIREGNFGSDFAHKLMCQAIDSLQDKITEQVLHMVNEKIDLELNREHDNLKFLLDKKEKELSDEQF